MRPEGGNPLDLNNLPEDYTRDGKEASEDSSSSAVTGGYRRKKNGSKEGKDDADKVYECRFCSLKFCKSQALGGHMNRHRQERETETMNKARQLVFTNDLAPTHLGYMSSGQPMPHGAFHQPRNSISDASLPISRSIYSTARMFPNNSPINPPPPHHQPTPFIYPTHPPHLLSYSSQYHQPPTQVNDGTYIIGHAVNDDTNSSNNNSDHNNNYMCIGAPVGPGFVSSNNVNGGVRDALMQNQEEGLKWGRR